MSTIAIEQGKEHSPIMSQWQKFNQTNFNETQEWKEKKRRILHNFRQELSEKTGYANLPFLGKGVQFVSNGNEQQGLQTIKVKKNRITLDYEKGKQPRIKDLIDIAQDQGWKSIKLPRSFFMSNEIKAEIWFEAKKRGLEVQGYKPSRADEQRLEAYKNKQEENETMQITPDSNPKNEQTNEKVKEQENPTVKNNEELKPEKNTTENMDDLGEQLKSTQISQQEARKIIMSAFDGMPQNTPDFQNAEKAIETSLAGIYNNPSRDITRKDVTNMRDSMRGAMQKKMVKDFNIYTQVGMREAAQVKSQGLAEQSLQNTNNNKSQKHEPPKRTL